MNKGSGGKVGGLLISFNLRTKRTFELREYVPALMRGSLAFMMLHLGIPGLMTRRHSSVLGNTTVRF